jgi:hypothetical protein
VVRTQHAQAAARTVISGALRPGLATGECFRRILRLSWFGHQSRLLPPSVGWLRRPAETGHPPVLSSFTGGAQAPVDHLGPVDHEAVVIRGGQARAGPTAQSTSAMAPHDRHTMWWWLSPTRAS